MTKNTILSVDSDDLPVWWHHRPWNDRVSTECWTESWDASRDLSPCWSLPSRVGRNELWPNGGNRQPSC